MTNARPGNEGQPEPHYPENLLVRCPASLSRDNKRTLPDNNGVSHFYEPLPADLLILLQEVIYRHLDGLFHHGRFNGIHCVF